MTDYKPINRAASRLLQIIDGWPPSDEELARLTAEQNYQQLLKLLDQKVKAK